jgi:hypothetical protein
LAVALLWAAAHHATQAEVIDFGDGSADLPYVEDGITFTNEGDDGFFRFFIGGFGDGNLSAGTNDVPLHARASSPVPFDLVSLDIETIFRDWRIESSLGGLVMPSGTGTLDFTNESGFQGITSFDIILDPPDANGTITVDNIVVNFVPEPSTFPAAAFGSMLVLAWSAARLRRTVRQP